MSDTATTVTTLFGERAAVYVRYPGSWPVKKVCEHLWWAKTYKVESLYWEGILVRAYVKPHYLGHFEKANKRYIVPHSYHPVSPDDAYFVVGNTIYDE